MAQALVHQTHSPYMPHSPAALRRTHAVPDFQARSSRAQWLISCCRPRL